MTFALDDLQHYMETARDLVEQSGQIAMRYFGQLIATTRKADQSVVTEADLEAEHFLRAALQERFPDHAVLGEEEGESSSASGSDWRWIIDPIDGTHTFMRGIPLFGSVLALEYKGEIVVGAIHLPALHETVYAAYQQGCWWNGTRCQVSQRANPQESLVLTVGPRYFLRRGHQVAYENLLRSGMSSQTPWSICYAGVLVATGRADAVVSATGYVWDLAAPSILIREAGGIFTDWQGNPHPQEAFVASNGILHPGILKLIQE